jgi:hypothetical protein
MVDIISNSDTMNGLPVEYLTLVEQFGFFGVEDFQKWAFSSENKKRACSGVIEFQRSDRVHQVIMLGMLRGGLNGLMGRDAETDLDRYRHRDTFVGGCG